MTSGMSGMTMREEPECIKKWKLEQEEMLKKKDADEEVKIWDKWYKRMMCVTIEIGGLEVTFCPLIRNRNYMQSWWRTSSCMYNCTTVKEPIYSWRRKSWGWRLLRSLQTGEHLTQSQDRKLWTSAQVQSVRGAACQNKKGKQGTRGCHCCSRGIKTRVNNCTGEIRLLYRFSQFRPFMKLYYTQGEWNCPWTRMGEGEQTLRLQCQGSFSSASSTFTEWDRNPKVHRIA